MLTICICIQYCIQVYPPDYNPPLNETPDGTICIDDKLRIEKWGACWNRYYELDVSYFMSQLSLKTLGILKSNFSWQGSFTTPPGLETGMLYNTYTYIHLLLYSYSCLLTNIRHCSNIAIILLYITMQCVLYIYCRVSTARASQAQSTRSAPLTHRSEAGIRLRWGLQ